MSMHCRFAFALLICCTGARVGQIQSVTPVQKVIKLLENLRDEVSTDGEDEAKSYAKFACFCNDETKLKSDAVEADLRAIDKASATISDTSVKRDGARSELSDTQQKLEKNEQDLSSTQSRCAKEKVDFETRLTELDTDLNRLKLAKKTLEEAAPTAFLAVSQKVQASIQELMHVNGPGEYQTHTSGIVDLVQKLVDQFTETLVAAQEELAKATKACSDSINALEGQIQSNKDDTTRLSTAIETQTSTIETTRAKLVDLETSMSEAQLYLKDLTGMCEDRAGEWDQRSTMRHDELEALTSALSVLKDKVRDNEGARVLLQHPPAVTEIPSTFTERQQPSNGASLQAPSQKALSFLQARPSRQDASRARGQQASSYLHSEGTKLKSTTLTSLAAHVGVVAATSDDPFLKVKELIQKLIERLVNEATQEATKKGFCDEQLGKARQLRDFRWADSRKLQTKITGYGVDLDKAKEEKIADEKTLLETRDALQKATEIRQEEKALNLESISNATEGLEGMNQVISILKDFYKESAKAFIQASPVIVPDDAGESKGAYKGKQTSAHGIMGLLEVIKSDFEHTIKTTSESEKKAAADYESFKQESLATIKATETSIENLSDDIASLENKIETGLDDLKTTQGLMDKAIQELIDLNPMCVDSGMTHQQRVEKREAEMKALKCAHNILGGEDFASESC